MKRAMSKFFESLSIRGFTSFGGAVLTGPRPSSPNQIDRKPSGEICYSTLLPWSPLFPLLLSVSFVEQSRQQAIPSSPLYFVTG
jgi:hypothetical protein